MEKHLETFLQKTDMLSLALELASLQCRATALELARRYSNEVERLRTGDDD